MSYIDSTKKEAKKLFSILKEKSKQEILDLTHYLNSDQLREVLAKTKGYQNHKHMEDEWNNPTLKEIEHPFYKFSKEDVLNDIYPEFIKCDKGNSEVFEASIEYKPVLFLEENITSFETRNIVTFEENTNILEQIIQNHNGIIMIVEERFINNSSMLNKANKVIFLKEDHQDKRQQTIDPLNPILFNTENFQELFKYRLSEWLIQHLMKFKDNGLKIKLDKFKGFLNLNYLLQQDDELIKSYLLRIGIQDNREITESIITKHIFFSKEALIFAQCMIDYQHCFSESPSLEIQPNSIEDNILVSICEDETHKDYEVSKIIKNTLLNQIYNKNLIPYNLIILNNISLPKFWTPQLGNTIRAWHHSEIYSFDEHFNEILLRINTRITKSLHSNIKKFILNNDYYEDVINLEKNHTVYMSAKKISNFKYKKQKFKIIN